MAGVLNLCFSIFKEFLLSAPFFRGLRQVRTQYNRQNDDIGEVRAFLKIWQKQLAKRLTQKDKQLAADSHELRIKELVQLRNDQVTIHTGDLAGRLLVDVLTEDLMEAA